MPTIQYGDEGTDLILQVNRADGNPETQVNEATTRQVKFWTEGGSVKTEDADVEDAPTGKIKYTLAEGDLDVDGSPGFGTWHIQAYLEIGAGKWHSTVKTFDVMRNVSQL